MSEMLSDNLNLIELAAIFTASVNLLSNQLPLHSIGSHATAKAAVVELSYISIVNVAIDQR